MHQLTAKNCSDGPCPDLTIDPARGKTGGQAYIPDPRYLGPDLPSTPDGEVRWEMDTVDFEALLAQHLTDAALDRIRALREARAA